MALKSDRWIMAFYALMAFAALVATGWHNLAFFMSPGETDLVGYVEAALANSASTALALDVSFVGIVCQVYMLLEGRRVGMSWPRLAALVIGSAAVAVAVTFPLFLMWRTALLQRGEVGAADAGPVS